MAMRPLLIGPDERQQIAHLCNFASDPAHWFTEAKIAAKFVPGDHPEYVLTLHTYRCVFTWTESSQGHIWRQLSVSITNPMKLPNLFAVFTLATEFGLTGWDAERDGVHPPKDWMVHAMSRSVAVAQPVTSADAASARQATR